MTRRAARAAIAIATATATLALGVAVGPASGAAAAPSDPGFGSDGLAMLPFGPTASAAGVAALPGGAGYALAGRATDARGEGVLVARTDGSGVLDPAFAGDGSRLDRFGASGETPQRAGAIAVQADGSTLVAGVSGDALMLVRYRPDGSLDPTFGAAGVTLRDPASRRGLAAGSGATAIAIAPTGQIVVAGSAGTPRDPEDFYEEDAVEGEQIFVARYSERGAPDPAFGRDGFSFLQLGAGSPRRHRDSAARGLVLAPDGRIVVAGVASDRRGADRAFIARLTAGGALDTSFARRGRLLIQLGRASAARPASSAINALAALPGGGFLATGRATDAIGNQAVLLARFSATGVLSGPGFGRGDAYVTQLAPATASARPQSLGRALVLLGDGSAFVAGSASGGTLVARIRLHSGSLDCTYGELGRAVLFGGRGFAPAGDGALAAVASPAGAPLLAGRLAGGGVLLGSAFPAPGGVLTLAQPRLRTLGVRYLGRGRAYAYALVDGGCLPAALRFAVRPAAGGKTVLTGLLSVAANVGPRVVCTPITRLRAGRRYSVAVAASRYRRGNAISLRAVRSGPRALEQDDCAPP